MLLLSLIVVPFIGSLLCLQLHYINNRLIRSISFYIVLINLLISLFLLFQMKYSFFIKGNFFHNEISCFLPWIKSLGINIHLSINNLSIIMIILTNFLGAISVLCSWQEVNYFHGFFYFSLLWIIGSVIGVFLSEDLFLFFFFWEMISIPIYFIILIWKKNCKCINLKVKIANKFFIYNQICSLLILTVILYLSLSYYLDFGVWTFSYNKLLHHVISSNIRYILMLTFFIAFAIKIPLVPLHSWMPLVHNYLPTAGSIELVGIIIKIAVYGLLHIVLPFFPNESIQFSKIAMFLGIINIFYGAFAAYIQTNVKKIISYANISHMGYIIIAVYSMQKISYCGLIIQILSYSLTSAGMFIVYGQLYERINTFNLKKMGGLWDKLEFIPKASLFLTSAMIGVPCTGNFIGEIYILLGTFIIFPIISLISILGLILNAVYILFMMQNIYYGPNKVYNMFYSITFREKSIVLLLIFSILYLGLYPMHIINISSSTMNNILTLINFK